MALTPFNAGEPLDIDKLNQLTNAVIALENKSTSVANDQTVNKIAKVWSGQVGPNSENEATIAVGTAGTVRTVLIDYSAAGFAVGPKVVAIANKPKFMVSVTGVNEKQAKIQYTTSSTDKDHLSSAPYIHWIAVAMEDNT